MVGEIDGPPMQWTEGEREPSQVAAGFAVMVDAELRRMERFNANIREHGGFSLTLGPDGRAVQYHPSLASGEQPSDL